MLVSMKDGWLPPMIFGTLLVSYFVFAALHDISRADESDYTLEYTFLVLCAAASAFLYRKAFRLLAAKARAVWLAVTGAILLLFALAAVSAAIQPKYANDRVTGICFLAVGLPLLGLLSCRLVQCRRAE